MDIGNFISGFNKFADSMNTKYQEEQRTMKEQKEQMWLELKTKEGQYSKLTLIDMLSNYCTKEQLR